MSEQDSASERIQKKINKITQEKYLLQSRLNVLNRENKPNSYSREQSRRARQIYDIETRLTQINEDLKSEKYFLARAEDRPIQEVSDLLQNLSIDSETEKHKKLNRLEQFIDLTAKNNMVFHSPTQEIAKTTPTEPINTVVENMENETDKNLLSPEQVATTANAEKHRVPFSIANEPNQMNIDSQGATALSNSTPKQDIHGKNTKVTSMQSGIRVYPTSYNLPPNYESPEDRTARLEREKYLREEFDRKMLDGFCNLSQEHFKKTGTIPKNTFKTAKNTNNNFDLDIELLEEEQKMIEESIRMDNMRQARNSFPSNKPDPQSNENNWNQIPSKFSEFKPSPQKMNIQEGQKASNLNNISFENQQAKQNLSERFNSPRLIRQSQHQPHFEPNNFHQVSGVHFEPNNRNTLTNQPVQMESRNNVPTDYEQNTNGVIRKSFLGRLRTIPKFSGDSFNELKDFIDVSETLYNSCSNEREEQEFYEQMALQLRGEAKSLIGRLEDYNWTNIKKVLLKHFSYLSNKDILTSQIENLHQENDESLTKYTERARRLLREKNATYTKLTEEQRAEHNRLARRAFSKGIKNDKLREKIMIRGASSLEDAIAYSIEAENDALSEIPRGDLYCRSCRMAGHREKHCRRNETEISNIAKLANILDNLTFNRRNPFRNNRQNFGNMSRNPTPNFTRSGFSPNWNPYRNNNNNFPNGNWNNNNSSPQNGNNSNPFNRNSNQSAQNQNNNFTPNRGNFSQNSRQQQRTNNVIRNARIHTIQSDPESEIQDFSNEETEN